MKKKYAVLRYGFAHIIGSVFFILLLISVSYKAKSQNYGMRDDGGVNLPTITYWNTAIINDITERGIDFNEREFGALTAFYIKGVAIKTWKSGDGDVNGAQFKYKLWNTNSDEPTEYTVRHVGWSSNDGGGNQTWAGFGDEILITNSLSSGTYAFKIMFSITGTGSAGKIEDGPYLAYFEILQQSGEAEILSFEIENQIGDAVINSQAAEVTVKMYQGADITNLSPDIDISNGASISPESGLMQDFSNPVIYTVVAENGDTKVWTTKVELIEMPVYYSVTFNVDMANAIENGIFNPETDFVDVGANYNDWSGSGPMVFVQGNIYTQTTTQIFEEGDEILFKFRINGNWETAELYGHDNRQYFITNGENIYNATYDIPGQNVTQVLFANLQYPGAATIERGQTVEVFSQIEIANCELDTDYGYQ